MFSEGQIRSKVRAQLRASLVREAIESARLREQAEQDAGLDDDAMKRLQDEISALASATATGVKSLKVISFDDFKKSQKGRLKESRGKRLQESALVTLYGAIISASGIVKLLGHAAKGIAKILNVAGLKNIDPEKEGQTFYEISEFIHHTYLHILEGLAGKMGVPKEKRKLAANVMFGVLLGVAMTFTGIELYSAIKGTKLVAIFGEGGMAGIKVGEGAETGANIVTLIRSAFQSVPELAGVVVDTADTADDVMDAIEAVEAATDIASPVS
jgi:hypothetical protein